jgi:hypothetical protein
MPGDALGASDSVGTGSGVFASAKEGGETARPVGSTFDFMEPEENAISDFGSSCRYPTVVVQVFPSSSRIIENARQRGGLEALSGIGDEAYFRAFGEVVVEVSVRAGRYIVTVQADVDDGIDSSKTRAVNLARALVASLP